MAVHRAIFFSSLTVCAFLVSGGYAAPLMEIGGCAKHFTCCAQWDFFIPIMQTCVENEPATGILSKEKNNCARNSEGAVPLWARLETPEWRKYGVCNESTPVVTRTELEERERKEKERRALYNLFCGTGDKAHCSATETCFFDKEHDTETGSEYYADLPANKSVCLCNYPRGREYVDGSGACVDCKAGLDGKPAYVMDPPSSPNATAPVKSFRYGEFACALGANATVYQH